MYYSCFYLLRPPQGPPSPAFGLIYEGAIGQQGKRHLFVIPCSYLFRQSRFKLPTSWDQLFMITVSDLHSQGNWWPRFPWTVDRLDWKKAMPMSLLKSWPVKGLCGRCFICLRPPLPHTPPPYTLYTCIQVYLLTQGRGGELTREKVRGAIVHKACRKYQHDWLYLQSINSITHQ